MPEISLPRRTEAISAASTFVEGVARDTGWAEPDLSRLALAAIEAVSNAVEHGSGRTLRVSCEAGAGSCRLSVWDEGPGPPSDDLRPATLPPSDALGGRGLFILSQLADEVSVSDGTLSMVVPRSGS